MVLASQMRLTVPYRVEPALLEVKEARSQMVIVARFLLFARMEVYMPLNTMWQ